jgi:hypothetical protein
MPLTVTCPTCGHEYQLSSKLAGKTLRCKLCQGAIQAPAAPRAAPASIAEPAFAAAPARAAPSLPDEPDTMESQPAPARQPSATGHPQPLTYASPPLISKERMLAGRICYFLAGLGYLGATCVGIASLFAGAALLQAGGLPPEAAAIVAVIMIAAVAIGMGISTVYLICGINIRKGGRTSVIIALVLGSLHLPLLLAGIVLGALSALMAGANAATAIQLCIQVLYAAAVGQLIHYLIKVLREPRAAVSLA